MKLKKKSGLISAVIALSAASLVSVGFASWVISQGESKSVGGTITVEEVEDNRHLITATWVDSSNIATAADASNPVVYYGHPVTPATGLPYNWLTYNGSQAESLVFYLKVNITNVDSDSAFTNAISSIVMTEASGNYAVAYGDPNNYVGSLPALVADSQGVGSIVKGTGQAGAENSWEAIYTISFKWGSHFNYSNPHTYYNGYAADAKVSGDVTYAADAAESLDALKTLVDDGLSFTLTITTL